MEPTQLNWMAVSVSGLQNRVNRGRALWIKPLAIRRGGCVLMCVLEGSLSHGTA